MSLMTIPHNWEVFFVNFSPLMSKRISSQFSSTYLSMHENELYQMMLKITLTPTNMRSENKQVHRFIYKRFKHLVQLGLADHFCSWFRYLRLISLAEFDGHIDIKLERSEAYLLKLGKNLSYDFQCYLHFMLKCSFKYMPISQRCLYLQRNK